MNEIKNELNKIYKLTGIRLSVENEAEIDIVNLKKNICRLQGKILRLQSSTKYSYRQQGANGCR